MPRTSNDDGYILPVTVLLLFALSILLSAASLWSLSLSGRADRESERLYRALTSGEGSCHEAD